MSRLCDSHAPFQTRQSPQTRDIRQSVTIILRIKEKFPTHKRFNQLHISPLSGNPESIAGHNKNEFP
ncbi:hypothetical protein EMIT0347P_150044 [Pseudomonas sp. IT-347P]